MLLCHIWHVFVSVVVWDQRTTIIQATVTSKRVVQAKLVLIIFKNRVIQKTIIGSAAIGSVAAAIIGVIAAVGSCISFIIIIINTITIAITTTKGIWIGIASRSEWIVSLILAKLVTMYTGQMRWRTLKARSI